MKTCTFVKLALSPGMFIPLEMSELLHLGLNGGERGLGAEGRPWTERGEGTALKRSCCSHLSGALLSPIPQSPPCAAVPVPNPNLEPTHPEVPQHTHRHRQRSPSPQGERPVVPMSHRSTQLQGPLRVWGWGDGCVTLTVQGPRK